MYQSVMTVSPAHAGIDPPIGGGFVERVVFPPHTRG